MVEGRVFLSILVDEWFLIPECLLSFNLVNSHSPQHPSPLPQTFVSQPGFVVELPLQEHTAVFSLMRHSSSNEQTSYADDSGSLNSLLF